MAKEAKVSYLDKKVKKLNMWDMQLIKLAVAAAVLLVLKMFPVTMSWVYKTNVWWFFAAMVIFGARPFYKCWVCN